MAAAIEAGPEPYLRGVLRRRLVDLAQWLAVPDNVTLLPLGPRSPELNPVENPGSSPGQAIWQFMRDNWLSNRIFQTYDDILAHCCEAWNNLTGQPWRIMSTGMRDWAHGC